MKYKQHPPDSLTHSLTHSHTRTSEGVVIIEVNQCTFTTPRGLPTSILLNLKSLFLYPIFQERNCNFSCFSNSCNSRAANINFPKSVIPFLKSCILGLKICNPFIIWQGRKISVILRIFLPKICNFRFSKKKICKIVYFSVMVVDKPPPTEIQGSTQV